MRRLSPEYIAFGLVELIFKTVPVITKLPIVTPVFVTVNCVTELELRTTKLLIEPSVKSKPFVKVIWSENVLTPEKVCVFPR